MIGLCTPYAKPETEQIHLYSFGGRVWQGGMAGGDVDVEPGRETPEITVNNIVMHMGSVAFRAFWGYSCESATPRVSRCPFYGAAEYGLIRQQQETSDDVHMASSGADIGMRRSLPIGRVQDRS